MLLGDDLGSSRYGLVAARLDFMGLPWLKKLNARAFTSAEIAYYPAYLKPSRGSCLEDIRGSCGFGVNIPLNEMISVGVGYNCANFGTRPGDIERSSIFNLVF